MADGTPTTENGPPAGLRDLEPAGPPVPLPPSVSRPLVAAASEERLHLLALDGAAGRVVHLALDANGVPAGAPALLPLATAEAVAVHEGRLFVVGNRIEDGRPVVLCASPDGEVIRESLFQTRGQLVMPRLLEAGGRLRLVWSPAEERAAVRMATVEGEGLSEPLAFDLGDQSFDLRAAPAGEGVTLLRTHGEDLRPELVQLADGAAPRTSLPRVGRAVSPDIVAVGDDYAVLFVEGVRQALVLRWLDRQLRPIGEPEVLALSAAAQPHSARFVRGDAGRLAIAFRMVAATGGFVTIRGDEKGAHRREPARSLSDHVAAYDGGARSMGPVHDVSVPGVWYDASGWVADTLLLLAAAPGVFAVRYRGVGR